jgi:DNA-binding PadR family transcriptional regulator
MEGFLKDIIAGSILYQLKEKGYVNSYEDENTDEVFFLTEEGREYVKNISNNESV